MSPIANYSTDVKASKSIKEIENMLVAHGAKLILTDYDQGEPIGLAFIVATPFGEVPFRMPANIERVKAVLVKQRVRVEVSQELASRVAWRILKDWVRAQMAILDAQMVTVDQIFLPYMEAGEGGKTLYDYMLDHRLQIPGG
jgi:hypothetical protein